MFKEPIAPATAFEHVRVLQSDTCNQSKSDFSRAISLCPARVPTIRLFSQHSSIVCEGQKAYVSCSSIFDQIEVVGTMYGRKDKSICVHPSIPSDMECQEQGTEVQEHIKEMCEGEHSCEVAANNNFMAKAGTVICPDVYKYLQIRYRSV